MMSHINGDITRTRELLSEAVHHLDSYNAICHSPLNPATSSQNARQNISRPTTASNGAPSCVFKCTNMRQTQQLHSQ